MRFMIEEESLIKFQDFSFNSLYEIPKSSFVGYFFPNGLSILFMRFIRKNNARYFKYSNLSILFMRFCKMARKVKYGHVNAFNSLYEIPTRIKKEMEKAVETTFNSLYEIHIYWYWAGWNESYTLYTFNSLYEIPRRPTPQLFQK